jgi:hypothetical protein
LSSGAEDGAADHAEIMIRRAIAATLLVRQRSRHRPVICICTGPETAWILRSDQECCNDGWWAYEEIDPPGFRLPKVFQKPASICPWCGLLTACHELVRVSCSGNREQRQERNNGQRFHARYGCTRL